MAILTSANYPSIRAAIDIEHVTTTVLPDATIALPIYHAEAELEIIALDPLAESRTDDDLTRIKNATIYRIASKLVPAIPQLIQSTYDDVSQRYEKRDWEALADELLSRSNALINTVLSGSAIDVATHFTLAQKI